MSKLWWARAEAGTCGGLCYNTGHRRPPTPKPQHIHAPLDAVQAGLGGASLSAFRELRHRALEHSLPVFLVGGPVRDVLMGMPIKDLDFVVEGDAPLLARQLAKDLDGEVIVYPSFGTASVVLEGARVDVVTARREVYPQPAALPQVTPGTIDDDLARRDFTINALALPLAEDHPQVLDLHGGVDDIGGGAIRVLHSNSFMDDPTRALRAVRFEQRLDFRIEDGTLRQLREAIARGHMSALSGDRLRHELARIFEEERPELALGRAACLGILAGIHPSLTRTQPVERLADAGPTFPTHGDSQAGRGQPLSTDPDDAAVRSLVYLAALAYPLSTGEAEGLIHRLNMPNSWAEVVRDTIALKEREPQLSVPTLRGSLLVRLVEELAEPAVLAVSRVTDSPLVARHLARYLGELRHLSPTLDGRDLLALGVPLGPRVGQLLRELRDARLDGQINTEEEERRLVQESLARGGQPGNG